MRFSALLIRSWIVAVLSLVASIGLAQPYVIERFNFDGVLSADGTMQVKETIQVLFNESRHGIFRTIPIHYDTGKGVTRDIYLTKIQVTDEHAASQTTKITTEGRYLKIRIGDADTLLQAGTRKTYVIQYVADGMMNWFDTVDDWVPYAELYWGITGEEWDTEMDRIDFRVEFPKAPGGKGLRARLFYGPYGSRLSHSLLAPANNSYDAATGTVMSLTDHEVRGSRNLVMPAYNGLTLVLNMPSALIAKPSLGKQIYRIVLANSGFLIPILVLGVMLFLWFRHGRDPDGGPMVVQFDPPDGVGGPALGAMLDETVDQRDLAAGIVSLAVKGYLKILPKEEGLFFKKRTADLELTKDKAGPDFTPFEAKLFGKLKHCSTPIDESELRTHVAPYVGDLRSSIYQELVDKGYYRVSPEKARNTWGCLGVAVVAGMALASFWISPFGNVLPSIVGGVAGVILMILFARGMPRRTIEGARALAKAKGFEEFVRRARKDELDWMSKKHPDAALFEAYLPHAVAMGLTQEWAQAFEGIVKEMPDWYGGPRGAGFRPSYFASDLGAITQSVGAAASVPPRSSGGSGGSSGFSSGGGFSGGGFGGGGGGSW